MPLLAPTPVKNMADAMEDIPSSEAQIASPDDKAITGMSIGFAIIEVFILAFISMPNIGLRQQISTPTMSFSVSPSRNLIPDLP